MQKYGDRVCPHVESALLRMHFCRTTALGKRVYRCDPCNHETTVFNSCGDRNCPQCSGARRRNWLDSTLELTHPKVTYFQVVMTLPDTLSSLTLGNRREVYELLFQTARDALKAKIEKDLGIQAAGVSVLHTWNQHLGHHPHIHMMVPGNGPSLDGKRWVDVRTEWCRKTKQMKPFLVDNKELGRNFRDMFLDGIDKLARQGKIKLESSVMLADLIGELRLKDWVVFIEGPPKPDTPPSQMLKYLTRYLTGGPISDRRIVGEKEGRIYFYARSKTKGAGQVVTSLSKVEFVQQWCLHILPKEFTKTRHFGAWSGSLRRTYMEQCRELAPVDIESELQDCSKPVSTDIEEKNSQKKKESKKTRSCAHCGGEMKCIVNEKRPSWRDLFYGPDHPSWFEWTSLGQCSPPDQDSISEEPSTAEPAEPEPDIFDMVMAGLIE